MLKELKIKNFQAHEAFNIKFSPGINTIVGESDLGKSAIIRAIKWAVTNSPAGDDFIRHGTKGAEVTLTVKGAVITRSNISGKNLYSCNDDDFSAFKRDVPDTIQQILRMGELNFQYQFDKPYWFDETAGEVSRQLNRIVNLEIIDSTLSTILSELQVAKAAVGVSENRIKTLEQQKTDLSYVVVMDKDFCVVEKLEASVDKLNEQTTALKDILVRVATLRTRKKENEEKKEDLTAILIIGDSYVAVAKQYEDLFDLETRRLSLQEKIKKAPPAMDSLEVAYGQYTEAANTYETLLSLTSKYTAILKQKEEQQRIEAQCSKEIQEEIGDKCPLCGNLIEGEHNEEE